jgi:hypothetical protein
MVAIETLAWLSVIIALMLISSFSWIIYMVFFREKQPIPQQPTPTEESDQPESQQSNQQSETPTPTPRKIPIGIIAVIVIVIAVIAIPLGIIFLIPGDLGDKIEKAKSVIPREAPEIPEIPIAAVIHITDFRREDKIKTGQYIHTDINSEGHLIVKTTDDGKSATTYFTLDKKFQKREAIKIQATVKLTNGPSKSSGFGAYIKDSDSRKFVFDGQKINFPPDGKKFDFPDNRAENGEYKIVFARVVSNDNKTAELRAEVDSSRGKKDEQKITYDLFQEKNLIKLGLNFYSRDRKSELEISEIIIYASEN